MISESVALARLARERTLLRNYHDRNLPKDPEIRGMILGLNLASAVLIALWKETKERFRQNPRYVVACLSNLRQRKKAA